MLISIIIPSFYPAVVYGGTITASLNYARMFVQLGHHVNVSTTNANKTDRLEVETNKFLELERNLNVKYYNETIVDKLSIPFISKVWRDIRKADLVHIHALFNTPIPFALLYAKILNKPVLLSPHGVLGDWIMNHGLGLKKLWLHLFIRPFATYVYWHATSVQEENEILSHFPKANIHIIPNVIDLSEFTTINTIGKFDYLKKFAGVIGEPDKIIVSMGRLQNKKGFDILIQSFKMFVNKNPNAFLFIAGDDDGEQDVLQSLISNLNLTKNVFLIGNIQGQDKVDFLGNADLFVLPSHNENFGMVYAEALATGTPVIASTLTPWQEVEEYRCGKWVNNTPDEITKAIVEILDNNDPDIKMNAKNFVKKFSLENIQKEFNEVIKLIAKKDV